MGFGKFAVETVFKATDMMTSTVRKMNAGVSGFIKDTEKGLKKLDKFNSSVSAGLTAAAGAAVAAGAAAGTAMYDIGKTGASFEQAITNVAAVSLMTRNEVADLESEARRLGRTTKFSATEVAQGMELMGKAGFTNAQVLKGIGPLLSAAAAEGADFETVAGLVSNTLKGMGMDVSETGRVADVLTLASARTNSSISSLGESLKNVAPVARTFGISFETATAAVALLQDVGIDASEAGTATATMLTKLTKPTDAVKAKMKSLGVVFQDAKGNMLPFEQVLSNMSKAAKKSGGNMKTVAFFADLVGLRGQKAALNLQEMFNNGKWDELVDELAKASGKAKEMADIRMNTLTGDLTILGNTVDDLKISLFDLQSGPLRGVVQGMTNWVTANKDLIIEKVQSGVQWLTDHLPEIVDWCERIGKAVLVFGVFAGLVNGVQFAIEAYEAAVVVAETTQWAFKKAIGATTEAVDTFRALNAAAHMSKTGQAIEGVQSKLGKAGLLASVFAVGYAFGTWLNNTFALDEKISGWVAKLTGLEDKLNEMGGRAKVPGLDPKGDEYLADGSIRRKDGTWVKKTEARKQKEADAAAKAWRGTIGKATSPIAGDKPYLAEPISPGITPQLVTPQARVAQSISETTETTKAELVIKDESGNATVTKPSKAKNFSINLQPSGAF